MPAPNKDEHRINDRIRVPNVRLIDQHGGQVGVVTTVQALTMARDAGLDLMEVSANSNPPVCKIVDYGKFKYEKKKKEHDARKKQTVIKVKEVQLRPQTEEHDLDYKFKNIRKFLEEGDKAKITIMFRGREITYVDQGYKIMKQLAEQVKDIGMVEAHPKLEGKKLIMILTPVKAGSKPAPAPFQVGPRANNPVPVARASTPAAASAAISPALAASSSPAADEPAGDAPEGETSTN